MILRAGGKKTAADRDLIYFPPCWNVFLIKCDVCVHQCDIGECSLNFYNYILICLDYWEDMYDKVTYNTLG